MQREAEPCYISHISMHLMPFWELDALHSHQMRAICMATNCAWRFSLPIEKIIKVSSDKLTWLQLLQALYPG